ncbi:MAG TPA: GNAT family N-acetyltransferase [Kofleriaceae bacterium]
MANTSYLAALARGAREVRHGESGMVVDGRMVRLSDPCTDTSAFELGDATMLRGPVAAVDALAARHGGWRRVFEGHEMVWRGGGTDDPRCVCAATVEHPLWRAEFIAEAFAVGGSPPEVPRDQMFVWCDQDPRAMAGVLHVSDDVTRIVVVYTPPAWRGRGYAGALVGALANRAGTRWVSLDVSVDNPAGLRAYERVGFECVGRQAIWLKLE